jgi:hypothetical protein
LGLVLLRRHDPLPLHMSRSLTRVRFAA